MEPLSLQSCEIFQRSLETISCLTPASHRSFHSSFCQHFISGEYLSDLHLQMTNLSVYYVASNRKSPSLQRSTGLHTILTPPPSACFLICFSLASMFFPRVSPCVVCHFDISMILSFNHHFPCEESSHVHAAEFTSQRHLWANREATELGTKPLCASPHMCAEYMYVC